MNTWCILVTEVVIVPSLTMMTSTVSEESLVRDTHTHTHAHAHAHAHAHTHTHTRTHAYADTQTERSRLSSVKFAQKEEDIVIWFKCTCSFNGFFQFGQNDKLKGMLFSTYPKTLVEASPLDALWGIGYAEDNRKAWNQSTWRGKNLLGFALTDVRNELMKQEGRLPTWLCSAGLVTAISI